MFIIFYLQCLIFLEAVHLLTHGGGTHWPASELWGIQWWTKGSTSPVWGTSLKVHTHTDLCASCWTRVCTDAHMQPRAAQVNHDVSGPDILEMLGARKWGYASCHLCHCVHVWAHYVFKVVGDCTMDMMFYATVSRLSTSAPLKRSTPTIVAIMRNSSTLLHKCIVWQFEQVW